MVFHHGHVTSLRVGSSSSLEGGNEDITILSLAYFSTPQVAQ
jgi:hypothetical protein